MFFRIQVPSYGKSLLRQTRNDSDNADTIANNTANTLMDDGNLREFERLICTICCCRCNIGPY